MSVLTTIALAFPIFLFSILWIHKLAFRNKNKTRSAPEAGGSWPFIGHLHLLGGPKPPHIVLGDMAEKHGPIFTIKMGVYRALVVSNRETAKECLTTNDKTFATRPHSLPLEVLTYNRAMFGSAPYGPYWRQMRKIATLELLSNHRLSTFKHVRESEIRTSLKELYQLWNKNKDHSSGKALVEMDTWFRDLTLNVILRIIVGKRIPSSEKDEETERWRKALKDFFEWSGKFAISDAFPFLRWLDIGGDERSMRKVSKELDEVVDGWLQDHKLKRSASGKLRGDEDFMDVMLSILDDDEMHDADTINKATCLGLILAGSDTTMVTLTWALSLLLNNRDTLKKAQEELNNHIGKDELVEEANISKLVYLHAIIKETLRLYPAGPLSVPHEAMEDCIVSGYHIPAGTRLLTNIYKLHRDPRIWSDPYKFRPERFVTTHKDVDVRGQNFELIPFGSGRRICPGISFALQALELTLANLLHGFEFDTPSSEPIDMEEALGLSLSKATPLQVLIAPRLPDFCY